jgi:hypothetical protein
VLLNPIAKRSAKGFCAGTLTVAFVAPVLVFLGLMLLFVCLVLAGVISAIQEGVKLYQQE